MDSLQVIPDFVTGTNTIEFRCCMHKSVFIIYGLTLLSTDFLKIKLNFAIICVLHKYGCRSGGIPLDSRLIIVFSQRMYIFRRQP